MLFRSRSLTILFLIPLTASLAFTTTACGKKKPKPEVRVASTTGGLNGGANGFAPGGGWWNHHGISTGNYSRRRRRRQVQGWRALEVLQAVQRAGSAEDIDAALTAERAWQRQRLRESSEW